MFSRYASSLKCLVLIAVEKLPFAVVSELRKEEEEKKKKKSVYSLSNGLKAIRSSALLWKGTPNSRSLTMTSLNSSKKTWSFLA